MRGAAARRISQIAMLTDSAEWKAAAIPELRLALQIDYTSADLLARLIDFELNADQVEQAQAHFDKFRRIAKASPLIAFVKNLHERQPPPSLPNPDGLENHHEVQ